MPQRTLRFKIHQDGKVEETVEGFYGETCNDATKSLENSLGEIQVRNRSTEAFINKQSENLSKLSNESNVSF